MNQEYTYKMRLYPSEVQEKLLAQHFGSIRYVYNFFLDRKTKFYKEAKEKQLEKKTLTYYDMAKELALLKTQTETSWLSEVNAQSLQHALKHLDAAYTNFFKKLARFPRFKSKKNKQSFHVPQSMKVGIGKIYIPKFREGIRMDDHRRVEGEINSVTITKNVAGQYYACIGVTRNIEPKPHVTKTVGIDLGIKTLVTCSDGIQFENIKTIKKYEKLLKIRQQGLSRTKKGSNSRAKARLKVGKIKVKVSNVRHDYLHKITSKLISENQTVVCEDLSVDNMVKNHSLAKSILDASWGVLVRQLTYKAGWYGRELVKIDRFYPSSKTCSQCGYINDNLTLGMREWDCPECKTHLDRDLNASMNIERQVLKRTVGNTGIATCPDVRHGIDTMQLVGVEA